MRLAYVRQYVDNRGKVRTYFRYKGTQRPLPSPDSADFPMAYREAYRALVGSPEPSVAAVDTRTIAWLIRQYRASPEFKRLAERTRSDYSIRLAWIEAEHGHRLYGDMDDAGVMKHVRDPHADHPRKADHHVATLSAVCKWAVRRRLMASNPCHGIEKLYRAGDGYRAWRADEIATFLTQCTEWEFTVFALAIYTAQRPGDLVNLTWFQYDGECFRLRQSKTKVPLVISAHPTLREALAKLPKTEGPILAKRDGTPMKPDTLTSIWSKVMRRVGVRGCTLHGLRATNATILAEGGASARQIMSSTGHKTLAMVEHYTRCAEQARLNRDMAAMMPTFRRG